MTMKTIDKTTREELVTAQRQDWVQAIHSDIINTFTTEYRKTVTTEHAEVLEQVCNLLISLIDGSNTGWYCIPMQVGQGKTEGIKHLVKFIHEQDLPYSIAFSAEKIAEVQSIYDWLIKHGVPEEKLAQVHSQVDNLKEVFDTLSDKQFVIHTHAKLRGGGYLDKYFSYKGDQRTIFVFDESMLSSIVTSSLLEDTYHCINSLLLRYDTQTSFSSYLPVQIRNYFSSLSLSLRAAQEILKNTLCTDVALDRAELTRFTHDEIVRYGVWIDEQFNSNFFSVLLQIGSSSPETCSAFIERDDENKSIYFLAARESVSPTITNLVTTDASRETRCLFKYSANPVRIYPLTKSSNQENLVFHTTRLRSGSGYLEKVFGSEFDPNNLHLVWIHCIISDTRLRFKDDEKLPDEPKFLIFYPKRIPSIRYQVTIKLLEWTYREMEALHTYVSFETFGRENATNEYRDCDVVIFMGLPYKPRHAHKALLLGEANTLAIANQKSIIEEITQGEVLLSLHQGSGRGKLRQGLPQTVYFCDTNLEPKITGLKEAFPGATIEEYLPYKLAVKMLLDPFYKSNEELALGRDIGNKPIKTNGVKWGTSRDNANNFIKAARNKGIEPDDNLVREYLGQYPELKALKFLKSNGLI